MKTLKILTLSLLIVTVLGSSLAFATEKKADEAAMMKAWQAYATPGKEHKYLAQFAGEWEGDTKMWMTPGAPPSSSKITSKAKMILGGRYLKAVYKGSVMGMPFEGIGITAFDNHLKKFVSTWIDSAVTGIMVMEGEMKGDVRVEKSEHYNFVDGSKIYNRTVTKILSKDKFIMEMYETRKGQKEFKTMEMVMVRKKK